jgi:LysM repeat protein
MNQSEFISVLEAFVNTPNYYDNTYPNNLLFHHTNGKFSGDCWNTIKCILSGATPDNIPVGTHFDVRKLVTGDVDGLTLLKRCTERSKDFSKIHIPGTYMYIYSSPHSGIYVGEREVDGHIVNVIECTAAWKGGIQYTYVDENGGRYNYKGGSKNKYSWEEYGLLTPYVEYADDQEPEPVPVNPCEITFVDYTVKKGDTLSGIAKKYDTTLDALLTANPSITNPNMIYVGQTIRVPVKTMQTSTSAVKDEKVYHTVQRGETLSGIASKYGTNYMKLAAMNGIVNPNKIYVGQKIRVR